MKPRKPTGRSASKRFEVRRSPIHGQGVFALERLSVGDFIGRFAGRRTDVDTDHTLWVEHANGPRGYLGTGRLRHLNHSSRPNAEFDDRDLFAIRSIKPGDEITFDYGEEWDDVP